MRTEHDYVGQAVALHSDRAEAIQRAAERVRAQESCRVAEERAAAAVTLGARLTSQLALLFGSDATAMEFAGLAWWFPVGDGPTASPDASAWVVPPADGRRIVLLSRFQGVPIEGSLSIDAWRLGDSLAGVACTFAVVVDRHRVEFRDLASFGGAVKRLQPARAHAASRAREARPWWQRLTLRTHLRPSR